MHMPCIRGFLCALFCPMLCSYQAVNQQCSTKHQCFTCWPSTGCQAVSKYERLTVVEHGRLEGRAAMKAEVYARGPISCEIDATEALDQYDVSRPPIPVAPVLRGSAR